ncbi:2OG-Fe(II) oxygenase [Granulosicoccus antarcticus]|uniref:Fe2OG dioxygenase domain-containing protein n=1 Tax=Granulosicoccus antarcticus IMCC3135 TaxID=1192854 RepID=A0A2Z2NSX3_9GAMM|nr:2OG-Fe(II) oxygenase [Granulosicoccus antarcticus]ASJ70687.1 hypothetical protein IMCC3135_02870 [Granulosicoccus antarcticus IMCC3135]
MFLIVLITIGDLRLPIAMTRAKALARIATSAPFGLGRATVIDPSVRDVGEIKASKVRFDRRAWNRELKPVLEAMRVELGLPDGRLSARLDKLLVYGPGQFFKPHKDTERSDEMIGTLVVVLPSRHKGGSLVINHQGETRRFVVRNPADPLLRLFAFYATCEHEVRPVSEGHRVVLSFELRFKCAGKKGLVEVEPALEKALESWFDPAREPACSYAPDAEKLVFLLDHDYSQRSLSWQRLKGVDHRRAEALHEIELLRSFSLTAVKPAHFKALLPLGQHHGADFCQTLFAHWSGVYRPKALRKSASGSRKNGYGRGFDRESDRHRLDWLSSFAGFCRRVNALNDDAWKAVVEPVFDTLYEIAIKDHAKHHAMVSTRSRRQNVARECTQIQSLLEAAQEINGSKVNQIIVMLIQELEHYASEVPVVVLEHLTKYEAEGKLDKARESLVTTTRKLVKQRAVTAIRAKDDWRIDVPASCKCADCQMLIQFLQSRDRSIDLPLAKERRQHLHGRIERYEIPVSHSTRREGRPFVLELRKLHKLFVEAAQEHARENELLERAVLA